jgi:hypothetical protein
MESLEKAIRVNQIEQKKQKKERHTKPELFFRIEKFIRDKQLIGYGGTAINHALPKDVQFYQESDIPDYDFFSTQAIEDIRELADTLYPTFKNIEVKPAMFMGTYKLFVNYLPLVDITQVDKELFHNIKTESFKKDGIFYVPYNYLRMSMYQELARPLGDLTRWTKVFQRLELLNQYHPFLIRKCDVLPSIEAPQKVVKDMVNRLKDYVILGDYAMYYWQELFPDKYKTSQQSRLFILSETIEEIWNHLKGLDVKYTFYENKLIKVYEVYLENYPILYVILTDSCMNYNLYKKRKIATFDTTLSIYYALSFVNVRHLSKQKLLSYCYLMLQINEEHPLMRRFHLPCYGKQITMEEIRRQREILYKLKKRSKLFQYHPKTRKRIVKSN